MSKLIKNELTKIFKKKSIYITLLVVLAFVILTNCIYKFFFETRNYDEYSDNYIQYIKEELAKLDPNKPTDTKMYIELKSSLDTYEMMEKYEAGAWQRQVLGTQISNYISEKNTYLYGENKDTKKVSEIEEKIDKILTKLEEGDWKYFAQEELEQAKISFSYTFLQHDYFLYMPFLAFMYKGLIRLLLIEMNIFLRYRHLPSLSFLRF